MAQGGVRVFRDPLRQPVQVGVDLVATAFDPSCDAGRVGALDRVGAVEANAVNRAREPFQARRGLDLYPGRARLRISASIRRPGELDGADNTQRPHFGVLGGTKANDDPARLLRATMQVHAAGSGTLDFHAAAVFDQQ